MEKRKVPEKESNSAINFESSNVFSKFFIFYPYKIINSYKKEGYNTSKLYKLKPSLLYEENFKKFLNHYKKNKKKDSFFKITFKYFKKLWLYSFFSLLIYNFISIAIPFLIRDLIFWFNEENPDTKKGYIYCLLLFFILMIKTFTQQHGFKFLYELGVHAHHIIFGIIFHKFSLISLKNIKYINSGQISSTLTIDIYRITQAIITSHQLIIAPLIVILNSVIIIYTIGWAGIPGVVLVIVLSSISLLYTKYSSIVLGKKLGVTDQRNKIVSNCINGIKSIKYNAWEEIIFKNIKGIRFREKNFIFKIIGINAYDSLFSFINPILAMFLSFSIMKLRGDSISLGDTYFILMLFNMYGLPMRIFFYSLSNFFDTRMIFNRIRHMINFNDVTENEKFDFNDDILKGEILIKDATFSYDDEKVKKKVEEFESLVEEKCFPVLENINLSLKNSEFIAIVGKVGSGKTSLLKAITKSIFKIKGELKKNGKIAYIPQTSFLINETIKENILFGKNLEKEKLKKIIQICELEEDLKILIGGLETEIGERGINLSGGQKQRINIARALYSNSDIYLIDDSLSALDSIVGQNIFKNVFKGFLKDKSRIMVTHCLEYLKDVDKVIFIDEGNIIVEGIYKDLIKKNKKFQQFCNEKKRRRSSINEIPKEILLQLDKKEEKIVNNLLEKKQDVENNKKIGKLIKEEKKIEGVLDYNSLKIYFKRGGYSIFFISLFLLFIVQIIRFFIDYWIGSWGSFKYNLINTTYFYIYLSSIIAIIIFALIVCYIYSKFASQACYNIFNKLISQILKKKMTYFDITPIGQILNLTSKDTDFLDFHVPVFLQNSLTIIIRYLLTFILMMITSFLITPFLLIYFILVFFILRVYIKITTEFRRLEQIAYSPIISNIKELYDGIILIRNYGQIEHINKTFKKNINTVCSIYYHDYSLQIFVMLVIELLNSFVIVCTFIFFVSGKVFNWDFVVRDPNIIALSFNYMFMLSLLFNLLCFFLIETIKAFTSLQRIFKNVDNTLLERSYDDPKPPLNWPEKGNIEVKNIYIKYQDHLPYVLNGLSFKIKNGEKIGVVGRTGSGKSTLLLALTRILELDKETDENYISIDDIKINTIGIKYLRKIIKVIPQDPFLMKGSLRFNIDPFNIYTDKEVIEVLKKCLIWNSDLFNIKKEVIDFNDEKRKLDYKIEDQGKNLSNGQRQLICLGRTLIEKPKFILMDEATSSIDPNSDLKIQKIIKNEFIKSTIITIAHRLNTIIFYDRILVLDEGKIVESGTPLDLIMKEDGLFRELIEENGNEFKKKMIECAKNKDILEFNN